MKKIMFFLAAAALFSFSACDKDENKNDDEIIETVEKEAYLGALLVDQNDGTFYTQEKVNVEITFNDNHAEIKMFQVAFSENMPRKLNMTIPGITVIETSNGHSISGDNIIPLALGGEFPNFTITGMSGTVTQTSMVFEMLCGPYPTSFSGTKIQ